MNNHICSVIVILFLSFRAFPQLHHQGHSHEVDSLAHKQISEITVQGILANKLNFPYQMISGEEAVSHGSITPANALHHIPGVALSRDATWATSVNIRGFSEAKLLFLADNDRMQTASDIAGVLSTIDMGNIEKIEVVKGAGSVIYGTGAMGGVVNFITKRPGYSDELTSNGKLSSGFHTGNNLWENNLNVNLTNRNWYLALDGSYRMAQNTMTPAGTLPNSQFNDASWGIRGGMKNGDNQELLINYNHFEAWNVGLPGGNAFPPGAEVRYLGFDRNQLSSEYIFTDLSHSVKLLSIKAYTQHIKRNVENIVSDKVAIFPGSANVTSGVKALADLYFNEYQTMTVGVEGWYRDQQTSRLKISTATTDTVLTKEQPTPKAGMLDMGVFAQNRWVVEPNQWIINTGLRLDFISTVNDTAFREISKHKYVNGVKTEIPSNKTVLFSANIKNELAYSAHVDVDYKPSERHRLIFSLANAYRVASIEERFKYIDQAGDLRVGNPALKPEKGIFSNLNYTYTGKNLLLKTDVFANYLFDLITEKPGTYSDTTGAPVQAWVNTNVDRAIYLGGEIDLRWLITNELEFETHASYVYAIDAITNEHLPLIPALHGIVKIHYHFHGGIGAYAEMDWEYESEKEHGENQEAHRHAIFNAGLHTPPYQLGVVKVQLFGGVQNIMNKAYEEHLSSLRGIHRLEPGRNFFVKARAFF
ncbi:MAG: TonB-dependent receptor [Paludibacter sp.]|nr:TonB-dependent receptor [Paludibacter sp.]MDD4198493.1 TonB-dependent receptor [Paludibacter sp.]MDD4427596.1 TonB-dependent receptor [Paludibacter sp.]